MGCVEGACGAEVVHHDGVIVGELCPSQLTPYCLLDGEVAVVGVVGCCGFCDGFCGVVDGDVVGGVDVL